jgi:phospholipase A2
MIGCLGYCEEMKRTGLWDLLIYFAGVSGSCWALAAFIPLAKLVGEELSNIARSAFRPIIPYQEKPSARCSLP